MSANLLPAALLCFAAPGMAAALEPRAVNVSVVSGECADRVEIAAI